MEMVSGATVTFPDLARALAEADHGPVVRLGAGHRRPPRLDCGDDGWRRRFATSYPPHTDEAFYIAEGELTFQLGTRRSVTPAGILVFVPQGVVPTARKSGSGPVRGLLVHSPGRVERIVQVVDAP